MVPIAKNVRGESLPLLQPDTANAFQVDGSIAHSESAKLPSGIYRVSVRTSTDNAGVMLKVYTTTVDTATTTTGMFMAHNSSEYFVLEEGSVISVIDGKVSVTPFK